MVNPTRNQIVQYSRAGAADTEITISSTKEWIRVDFLLNSRVTKVVKATMVKGQGVEASISNNSSKATQLDRQVQVGSQTHRTKALGIQWISNTSRTNQIPINKINNAPNPSQRLIKETNPISIPF